jgi:16S rRNA processing protein RimM
LKGELKVLAFAPGAPNLQAGRRVFVAGERHTVTRAREGDGAWILELSGLKERSAAEPLRGLLVEAKDGDVGRNDDESYFIHELVGLRVVTNEGRDLGVVVEVMQMGASDVYVVRGEAREVLIPAIGEVVDEIDVAGGVIRITPLAGLLDESK